MNTHNTTFASRLKTALTSREATMSELARACNITPQSVQQWVSGEITPRKKHLEKAACYLCVTPAWLLFGVKAPTTEHHTHPSTQLAITAKVNQIMALAMEITHAGIAHVFVEFSAWPIGIFVRAYPVTTNYLSFEREDLIWNEIFFSLNNGLDVIQQLDTALQQLKDLQANPPLAKSA